MRCEDCAGMGRQMVVRRAWTLPGSPLVRMALPCPSCGGTGIASCCEGATGLACDVTNEGDNAAPRRARLR